MSEAAALPPLAAGAALPPLAAGAAPPPLAPGTPPRDLAAGAPLRDLAPGTPPRDLAVGAPLRDLARPLPARPYPERAPAVRTASQKVLRAVEARLAFPAARLRIVLLRRVVRATDRAAAELAVAQLSDADLTLQARALRPQLARAELPLPLPLVARAFALLREAAHRTLGLRPRPVQLMGGYAMLRGWIAEMQTGEGKTLTALLPAAVMALAGRPVHVITVNDYLAQRDCDFSSAFFALLGLRVACASEAAEEPERRVAYGADVTYCTNKQVAFDYLRDRLARGCDDEAAIKLRRLGGRAATEARAPGPARPLMLRGLGFALVDEADSVLIDEARTPLILSAEGPPLFPPAVIARALALARTLVEGPHHVLHRDRRQVELTGRGEALVLEAPATAPEDAPAIAPAAGDPTGAVVANGPDLWTIGIVRTELVTQALVALTYYRRDVDYLVREGRVQIIDTNTGRTMPERTWSDGLHQLIEHKEGLELSKQRVTLARTPYQRFFARYQVLSGMTGTARDAAEELRRVYGLGVARIPTHARSQRRLAPDRVWRRAGQRWQALAQTAAAIAARGAPVLIGTTSVADSLTASRHLTALGVAHVVLNVAQDAEEAQIIHQAGQAGRVTVATNMAGRGADIPLGRGRRRRRWPACADERAARGAAHRPAVGRPLCAPGGAGLGWRLSLPGG